jgi:hypothetical protein
MNYVNYDDNVVRRYRVKIVGWTYSVFVNPADINTITDIRTLRDALKTGSCHWVSLSTQEMKDHEQEVEARRTNGDIVGKPRKERSDKGARHKRRAVTDENHPDGRQQAKRRKTGAKISKQLPPKSRAFIGDGDDDDDGVEGNEDGDASH